MEVEELEALRLADLEGKTHEEAAEAMKVSRQTFGRIVESARAKVAEALVSGKSIIIQGGTYEMEKRVFKCVDCSNIWEVPFCTEPRPEKCPKCGSTNFHRVGGPCMGPGRGPGMGRRGFGPCCQVDK